MRHFVWMTYLDLMKIEPNAKAKIVKALAESSIEIIKHFHSASTSYATWSKFSISELNSMLKTEFLEQLKQLNKNHEN